MSHDDMLTIYADILQVTDSAILADCAGEEVWLPLSQVDFNGEKGDVNVPITLPEWLADDKGLSDGKPNRACKKCGLVSKKKKCPGCGCSVFIKIQEGSC